MADVLVKPAFQSAATDTGDVTKFGPNAWNAARLFSGGANGEVLTRDTGAATGASWTVVSGSGGITGATIGDLLFASAPTTIGLLPDVAIGSVLVSGGVGAAPVWSATPTLTDLTLTGVLKAADGSSTAPSLTFANDPNTGFYNNTGSAIRVAIDGSQAFLFDGSSFFLLNNGAVINFGAAQDVVLLRDAADVLALRRSTSAQRLNLGQGNTALAAGRLAMGRDAAAAFAPGAGYGLLRWEAGTNAGTLKLVAYAGTSTTGVTVIDNVGGGN